MMTVEMFLCSKVNYCKVAFLKWVDFLLNLDKDANTKALRKNLSVRRIRRGKHYIRGNGKAFFSLVCKTIWNFIIHVNLYYPYF